MKQAYLARTEAVSERGGARQEGAKHAGWCSSSPSHEGPPPPDPPGPVPQRLCRQPAERWWWRRESGQPAPPCCPRGCPGSPGGPWRRVGFLAVCGQRGLPWRRPRQHGGGRLLLHRLSRNPSQHGRCGGERRSAAARWPRRPGSPGLLTGSIPDPLPHRWKSVRGAARCRVRVCRCLRLPQPFSAPRRPSLEAAIHVHLCLFGIPVHHYPHPFVWTSPSRPPVGGQRERVQRAPGL